MRLWIVAVMVVAAAGGWSASAHALSAKERREIQEIEKRAAAQVEADRKAEAERKAARIAAQEATLSALRQGAVPTDYREIVDRAFVEGLKDPDSRKLEFVGEPRGAIVCGKINAKNSYGGYTGKTPFVARFDAGGQPPDIELFSAEKRSLAAQFGRLGDLQHVQHQLLQVCGFAP